MALRYASFLSYSLTGYSSLTVAVFSLIGTDALKALAIVLKTVSNKYNAQTIKSELVRLGMDMAQKAALVAAAAPAPVENVAPLIDATKATPAPTVEVETLSMEELDDKEPGSDEEYDENVPVTEEPKEKSDIDLALTPFLASLVYQAGVADFKSLRISAPAGCFIDRTDPHSEGKQCL